MTTKPQPAFRDIPEGEPYPDNQRLASMLWVVARELDGTGSEVTHKSTPWGPEIRIACGLRADSWVLTPSMNERAVRELAQAARAMFREETRR